MKRSLDLRSGVPVWAAYPSPRVKSSRLNRNVTTDVLIVGAGISGAMIAEMAVSHGLKTVVIDRRGPLQGSTAATTALVQFEIDNPLTKLTTTMGKDRARQAWRRSRLALATLKARIDELKIKCDLSERSSLYLAGNILDREGIEQEAQARRQIGLDARYLKRGELKERFGVSRDGAILSHGNLALNPSKLTAGLLNQAVANGAEVYAPLEACAFERGREGVLVATKQGPTIRAANVVLATGYELATPAPSKGHRIVSTWAIATKPQRGKLWPGEVFMWEASDPYLYLRSTPDGRVICGGEDEDFEDEEKRDALIAEKARRIAGKLGKLLPNLDPTPQYSWTGSFGTTSAGLPIIGKAPGHDRIHFVMGYGGNGITFSRLAAEIVTSSLLGIDDADAVLFEAK